MQLQKTSNKFARFDSVFFFYKMKINFPLRLEVFNLIFFLTEDIFFQLDELDETSGEKMQFKAHHKRNVV